MGPLGIGGVRLPRAVVTLARVRLLVRARFVPLLFFERAVLSLLGLLFLSRATATFFAPRFGLFAPLALIGRLVIGWASSRPWRSSDAWSSGGPLRVLGAHRTPGHRVGLFAPAAVIGARPPSLPR